jgi:sialidase-1
MSSAADSAGFGFHEAIGLTSRLHHKGELSVERRIPERLTASRRWTMHEAFYELIDVFEPQEREGELCFYRAAPGMVVTNNNVVLATNQERMGTIGDSFNRKNVVLRRSLDDGKSWLPLQVVAGSADASHSAGAMLLDHEINRVILFFARSPVEDASTGHNEAWTVENTPTGRTPGTGQFLVYSDDDGATWSDPVEVTDTIVYEARYSTRWPSKVNVGHVRRPVAPGGPPGNGLQLRHGPHKGRLVATARVWVKPVWDLNVYSHNCVILSDDHGMTWRLGGLSQPGMGESSIVELADGVIYMTSRNESIRFRGHRGWDRSYDGGESFVESGYDLTLIEPHCHASIARYSWGESDGSASTEGRSRILFSNPAARSDTIEWFDADGRRNLTVRLSYDEAHTWPVAKTIYGGSAGYSALAVTREGTILCQFERSREEGKHSASQGLSSVARFNLAWLTDGRDDGD